MTLKIDYVANILLVYATMPSKTQIWHCGMMQALNAMLKNLIIKNIMVIELSGLQFGLKSNEEDREAGERFVKTSFISVQNCKTRSSISTFILYSF